MIKEKLDQYLEFDSDQIFFLKGLRKNSVLRVFGGAIRDIIAEEPIRDIDILVGSQTYQSLRNILERNGYTFVESLIGKDIQSIYSDIRVITEPHTFIKGTKIVQVIKPAIQLSPKDLDKSKEIIYKKGFTDLIQNVDISCCGISWDGINLYENYPGAISHCLTKSFIVNSRAKMYSPKRIIHRRAKLEERGWVESTSELIERDKKIDCIFDNRRENISYICEYKEV